MTLDGFGDGDAALGFSDGPAFRRPAATKDCRNLRRGTCAFIAARSFLIFSIPSRGQRLALGFYTKGQKQNADDERESGQSHGSTESLEVTNAGAYQKRETRRRKASDVGDECEGASAAFCSVLFRQPKGIHDEIGSAHA